MKILVDNTPLTAELINQYNLTTATNGGGIMDTETGEAIDFGDPVTIVGDYDGFVEAAIIPEVFRDYFEYCEHCGQIVRREDSWYVDDTALCGECCDAEARQCEGCGEWHLYRNMVQIEGTDDYVCERWDCMERAMVDLCEGCGYYFYHQDLTAAHDGCCYCEDCAPNHSGILDYSEKPEPEFYGERSHLHMGVELEVDNGVCVNDFITDAATPEIYFKEDGSLSSDGGVEIVSHPCTLDYHKGLWDNIIDAAKAHYFTSHDAGTCGLHVHIDREYLGEFETERDYTTACIVMLFDKFWKQLVRFSRRTENQLSQWCERTGLELTKADMSAPEKVADKLQDKANNEGRYKAVNLQNRNTVEFRLFRGTLRRETFYATLELCQVIVDWCKTHRIPELAALTWGELISSQPTEYLVDYCNLRGIDPEALGEEIKPLQVKTMQEGWTVSDLQPGDLVRISETAPYNNVAADESGKWSIVTAVFAHEIQATTLSGGVTWWLYPSDTDRIVRMPRNEVVA